MPTRTMLPRRWNVAPADERVVDLARLLKTSELLAQVLVNRGLTDELAGSQFLRPALSALHDPALLPGAKQAAERVAKAIRDGEPIVIFGDYDVDGITATSVLWHAIRNLGGRVSYYIPHRVEEGYGLRLPAVEKICDGGARLIITVDCGITAIDAVTAARERGVDVIITDHHDFEPRRHKAVEFESDKVGSLGPFAAKGDASHVTDAEAEPAVGKYTTQQENQPDPAGVLFPPANHIVHPRLPAIDGSATYPNPHLCGVGVAFKLAWALGQAIHGPRVSDDMKKFLVEALALVALGTIADVVPLVGENRVLAHFGLSMMKKTRFCGLNTLLHSANLLNEKVESVHVAFQIGPRLNACGRMGHAALAVEMLTDASPQRAEEIADFLEVQNRERQGVQQSILQSALEQIDMHRMIERDCRAIVVGGIGWHAGVVGIVASKIVEQFHRPVVVVGLNEVGQGSGRSIDGFHMSQAFNAVSHTLKSHGGHEMAAGLQVELDRFEDFRQAFTAFANETIDPALLMPPLKVDVDAQLRQIGEPLIGEFARVGPFGRGNPRPVLRCRGVVLTSRPRRFGKTGSHLELYVRQNGTIFKAIAYGGADWCDRLSSGLTVDLAVEPKVNNFNGRRSVELHVKDIQLCTGTPATTEAAKSAVGESII